MKKKVISASLVVALGTTVALTGCGGADEKAQADSKAAAEKVSPPGTFPIVKDKETLKVYNVGDPNIEDLNTNEFTKWYENKTNIHVDWTVVPTTAKDEKLQVTLAGGDLPDVFMNAGISSSQLVALGSQGVFLPLNDLIDKYAPNIKRVMEETASYSKPYFYAQDGNIYGLPNMGEVVHSTMPRKLWINKAWLDKLGLQVPTTTDELYNVLKAFKAMDPKIVPLSGANQANNEIDGALMQAFTYYERGTYVEVKDGQIQFSANTPGFKAGLAFMRKLVQEGLMQPEAFIQDRKALTALAEDPAGSRLGAASALYWGQFTVDNGPSGRYKDYVPVPVLKGPNGEAYGYDRGYAPLPGSFVITKDAKNPVAAIRWIDWLYDERTGIQEGASSSWGIEGQGWKRPAQGVLGLNGKQALVEPIVPFGTKTNIRWGQTAARFTARDVQEGGVVTPDSKLESQLLDITNKYYKPFAKPDSHVPFMFMSGDDLTKYGDVTKNIQNTVQQFMLKFITGNLDLDKDWDKYLKELDNAGLQQYIQILQSNYEKTKK
ncbi:extracellular solute-binding protein [Paenibacillus sp. NPDC056579]|uniref:extracellular solute-binding protein n=1 Tax=unclassified Paenibacillus TaxID=185978 RepID=UPI001EF97F63|nr:extracellular solute-binding protein [Paenibacillus sp. H1-7]